MDLPPMHVFTYPSEKICTKQKLFARDSKDFRISYAELALTRCCQNLRTTSVGIADHAFPFPQLNRDSVYNFPILLTRLLILWRS